MFFVVSVTLSSVLRQKSKERIVLSSDNIFHDKKNSHNFFVHDVSVWPKHKTMCVLQAVKRHWS